MNFQKALEGTLAFKMVIRNGEINLKAQNHPQSASPRMTAAIPVAFRAIRVARDCVCLALELLYPLRSLDLKMHGFHVEIG